MYELESVLTTGGSHEFRQSRSPPHVLPGSQMRAAQEF